MRSKIRDLVFVAAVLLGMGGLTAALISPARSAASARPKAFARVPSDLSAVVTETNASFRTIWTRERLTPTTPAADLVLMRRLALALTGTSPSVEQIRHFESRPSQGRVEAWIDELLADRRFADQFSERFARALVGTEDGPFLRFRRRRFTTWLSDALLANRPYDAVVRSMIADEGLWTDHPATNFITVTIDMDSERPSPERLAARVARAFLGIRLDCAQCHDHPFQHWKQDDFRGLAAFFGGVHTDIRGTRDDANDYKPLDKKTKEPRQAEPTLPFLGELRPNSGDPRDQLAAWVTDPNNPHLARATVNRVWALLLGKPLSEPIDDLASNPSPHPALAIIAADFASHHFDLHRLIRVITSTEVFRLDSAANTATEEMEEAWAVFPLTRLRPDQVAGAIFQAASLKTLGPQSHWFARLLSNVGRNEFVTRYGDTGEDEFDGRGGTIPQRLLLMNGDIVRERVKGELFNAIGQIATLAPDDRTAVEIIYLTVLTRRPTADEQDHFQKRLAESRGDSRKEKVGDLFWTLLNSTEFSWNH